MKCTKIRCLLTVAVAIFSLVGASSALADPFSPSAADIHSLSDQTAGFHGAPGQLSTIDSIVQAPDGIHLTVTYRVGNSSGCDPFLGCQPGEVVGLNFPRVSLAAYTNGENDGAGRLLFPGYDGIKWCLMSDQDVGAQPFVQTAPNWTFYEPIPSSQPITGDMTTQMAVISFSNAQNYSGLEPNTIVHLDGNGEIRGNAMGLQLVGPGTVTVENPVVAHIWITTWGVPEPSSFGLLGLGMTGLFGFARRRNG